MTGSLRSTARNPVAVALMGVLVLVFLILGVSGGGGRFPDAFRGINANDVVTAGQHTLSSEDFKRMFDRQKENLDQRAGEPVPVDLLVENGYDQQMLTGVAQEQSVLEVLRRSGIVPSDALVDGEIRKLPFAFNRITGQFDEKQFMSVLAQQGLTPRQAQAQLRDELARRHYLFALQAGFTTPRLYAAMSAVQVMENRDVSYFVLDQHAVPAPAQPTDAQLIAFMNQHKDQLTIPETRTFTLVQFSAKALEPTMAVDPAAVQKEFDFKKESLSTPETRSFVQIPVKTAAQGADAAARLQRGEDPTAVARAMGAEPVTYDDKPRSALPDTKVAAAAFALTPGQVSAPVQGDLGLAVLKLLKVTPGKAATLEQARPQIEAELRTHAAQDKVYEITDAFQKARDSGASVADAARKVGATATVVGPVTADGRDVNGKPIPGLDPKILKAAFAESAGGSGTEVESTSPGEYYALRVDKVAPPALPPLDQKRAELTQIYMRQQLVDSLKAKAEALMAAIRKGTSIDAAAAQVGAHVTHQVGLERRTAQQFAQVLGREFLLSIFGAKPGDVFAAGAPTGIFIARLDAVRPGDMTMMAQGVNQIRSRVSDDYLNDVDGSIQAAAQAIIKPNTNLNLARRAIGVSAEEMDKLNAKPAAKGGAKPANKGGPAA
ncbi:MAG TPA: peptidyl-prolyl cis-trans isomerase [Caulobacteraceae bacterium]|nr:peptidyl-prolyl cis-trans isomerase [Caulobacteraceae bacterium]